MGNTDSQSGVKKDDTPKVGDVFWWSGGYAKDCFLEVKQIDCIDGKPAYYICFVAGKGEQVFSKNELLHGRQKYGGLFQPALTEPNERPWNRLMNWQQDKEDTVNLLVKTFSVMLRHAIVDRQFRGQFSVKLFKGELFLDEIQARLDAEVCRPVGLTLSKFGVAKNDIFYEMKDSRQHVNPEVVCDS